MVRPKCRTLLGTTWRDHPFSNDRVVVITPESYTLLDQQTVTTPPPTPAADSSKTPQPFLSRLTSFGEFLVLAWSAGRCLFAGLSILRSASELPTLGKLATYIISAALFSSAFLLCTPRKVMPPSWLESFRRRRIAISILAGITGLPTFALAVIATYQDRRFAFDEWTISYPAGPGLLMVLAIKWWGEKDDGLRSRWFRLLLPIASTILWSILCCVVAYISAGFPRL